MRAVAQFDVHLNPTESARDGFPYLVVLQSDQLNHLPTRLVMPLQRLDHSPTDMPRRLSQSVLVEGEKLHLAAHQCAALPARALRHPVTSIISQKDVVRDALDAVISGI